MYITISDVRFYIMDRGSEDNPYLLDLAYSDEEISGAMRSAAREYNSVPPLGVETVHPGHLPADTNLFLDGIFSVPNAKLHRLATLFVQDHMQITGGLSGEIKPHILNALRINRGFD